jgi:hypothetical protein
LPLIIFLGYTPLCYNLQIGEIVVKKILLSLLILVFAASPVPAADSAPSEPPQPALAASSNKVDGLELPADQTVKNDEGFVTIQATTTGEVKWLVISAVKIKYFALPQNSIIVSIPPQGGSITVFAVALVGGKLTEFTKTNITVANPNPVTPPGPPGPAVGGPYHVSMIVDLTAVTPELAVVLNSQKVLETITSKNGFYRRFDIKSPTNLQTLKEKGLDIVLQKEGGAPLLVIQNSDGSIATKPVKIPTTEAGVLQVINSVLK